MSRPTEYFGQNPKNCGYRYLSNYYQDLAGYAVTSMKKDSAPQFVVMSSFGGTPYSAKSEGTDGNGNNILCNTWRRGECCDNRSLSRDAYSNCMSGICPSYYARSASY